jgi:hypothetical protein
VRTSPISLQAAFITILSLLAATPAFTQAPGQAKSLVFDPKFALKWPGKPSESNQVLATDNGPEKHYRAMFADKLTRGVTLYSASVEEFPEKTLKGTSPNELLVAYVHAFKKHETSRKEVEHGKKKYPGLEITSRRDKHFGRRLVVMAGSRIYDVSVVGPTEDALKAPTVKAFFDSLAVGD